MDWCDNWSPFKMDVAEQKRLLGEFPDLQTLKRIDPQRYRKIMKDWGDRYNNLLQVSPNYVPTTYPRP